MDYIGSIDKIISILKTNEYDKLSKEITEIKTSASTGSELILSVTHKLIALKRECPNAYKKIEDDVNQLTTYANSIGLYPR